MADNSKKSSSGTQRRGTNLRGDSKPSNVSTTLSHDDSDPYHDSLYEHGGGIDDDSVNEANENAEGFMIQDIRPQPFDFLYNKEKYHHPESDYDGSGHLLQWTKAK